MRRYERRSNYARLFRNKEKRESWQSDYRGKIALENGTAYFIGATVRRTADGEEFLSIYLRPDIPTLRTKANARGISYQH